MDAHVTNLHTNYSLDVFAGVNMAACMVHTCCSLLTYIIIKVSSFGKFEQVPYSDTYSQFLELALPAHNPKCINLLLK